MEKHASKERNTDNPIVLCRECNKIKLSHRQGKNLCYDCFNRIRREKRAGIYESKYWWKESGDQARWRRSRLRKHGLSELDTEDLIHQPEGFCNACEDFGLIVVDHDHSHCEGEYGCSDCIRGFLCERCNHALGHSKDDIERLRSLIIYLEEAECQTQS